MNHKQMVLFEEIVAIFSKGHYHISFMMDNMLCAGIFRKSAVAEIDARDSEGHIETDKLMADLQVFLNKNEEYNFELFAHVQNEPDFSEEKLHNALFNQIYMFLEEIEDEEDAYLTGYQVPYTIYNLETPDKKFETFLTDGEDYEPIEMFGLNLEEK